MPISLTHYVQSYTANNTGMTPNPPVYVPQQYPAYYGPNTGHAFVQTPLPNSPLSIQPTGRLITFCYRDPLTDQDITLHIDEAFFPIMLSISQQQLMTVYDAARPCWANPATGNADFSLDEMTEAEKVIKEMKRVEAHA